MFLTNNANTLSLFDWLFASENVVLFSEKLNVEMLQRIKPKLVISYNYSYIIGEKVISYMQRNIINLHISYLPWNRDSAPNLWSFIDNTPKGVTIHEIASGLDTGKIIAQKTVEISDDETLAASYDLLNKEIEILFKQNWLDICNGDYQARQQQGKGSYHTMSDLEKLLQGKTLDYNMTGREFREYCRT